MGKGRDLKKAAEECSELTTILLQQLNKPHKDFTKRVTEEVGDVLFRVENLRKYFDSKAIDDRINMKKKKNNEKDK